MSNGMAHPTPAYNVATAFNVFSVPGVDLTNFRQKLPPLLPNVTLGDVSRDDGPDTERFDIINIPPGTVDLQADFDHIFYFKLITSCFDPFTLPPTILF
jgi:hypothetical protein